jgi:signal transduction histidine kinase
MSGPRLLSGSLKTALGLLSVCALTLLPLFLIQSGAAPRDQIVARILRMEVVNQTLVGETMRLRLGLADNYDTLAWACAELGRETDALLLDLEPAENRAERELHEEVLVARDGLTTRSAILERFPTHNAILRNSLRAMPILYGRVLADAGSAEASKGQEEELLGIYERTLTLHAAWSADAALRLRLDLQALLDGAADPSASALGLARHALLTIENRSAIDAMSQELEHTARTSSLERGLAGYLLLSEDLLRREGRSHLWLQAACFGSALLVCGWIALSFGRQGLALAAEMTKRQEAHDEARAYEVSLRHSQKMESIGQLAAGIAHEINTPTQYISDNASFLRQTFDSILELHAGLAGVLGQGGRTREECAADYLALRERLDIGFAESEIPRALGESKEGLERIRSIVVALRDFSHPGKPEKSPTDLNRALETTCTVARSEWKYVAELELQLDPHLGLVPCIEGEIKQVFLNLIVNAAQAIETRRGATADAPMGRITVRSRRLDGRVEFDVEDTGTGISPEIRHRVFDPFFTTKGVGKGTGQGLAIAHNVVVTKHGGELRLDSEVGRGTCFTVTLPLAGVPEPAVQAA